MKFCVFLTTTLLLCSIATAGRIPHRDTDGDGQITVYGTAGEPPIAQDYQNPDENGVIRTDPDNEIHDGTRTYWKSQPFRVIEYVDIKEDESVKVTVNTLIDGKPDVVFRHVDDNDVIDWNAVAGENDRVHDHWPVHCGKTIVVGFDDNDTLELRGHTITIDRIVYKKGKHTVVYFYSQQGAGGGAHDEDDLGSVKVNNVLLTEDDIVVTNTNDGIVETWPEFESLIAYYMSRE
jgi:hypothetical protein